MSEPVTSVRNATATDGIAAIREIGPVGMITLRGDLASSAVRKATKAAVGVGVPDMRHCTVSDGQGAAWMSPDELLIMCGYSEVPAKLEKITEALGKSHALAANVSDARAVFEVSGPNARDVLAKLAPVDLAPDVFTLGMFRRTRMAQVPAAFWLREPDTFQIICFRSVGQYMFDLLSVAAQPSSEVGYFRPD
jgi:sarcosine oxidase subunit gamma